MSLLATLLRKGSTVLSAIPVTHSIARSTIEMLPDAPVQCRSFPKPLCEKAEWMRREEEG